MMLFQLKLHNVQIICISLGSRNREDKLCWSPEKRGFYSVKTAYWIARTKVMGDVLSNSSRGYPFKDLWKHVWEENVPGKVRICIWRACTNTLPTRAALCMKGYTGDTRCLLCPCPSEDTSHILIKCPFAQAVLAAPPLQIQF